MSIPCPFDVNFKAKLTSKTQQSVLVLEPTIGDWKLRGVQRSARYTAGVPNSLHICSLPEARWAGTIGPTESQTRVPGDIDGACALPNIVHVGNEAPFKSTHSPTVLRILGRM